MNKGLQNSKSLAEVLGKHETPIIGEWIKQMSGTTRRADLIRERRGQEMVNRQLSFDGSRSEQYCSVRLSESCESVRSPSPKKAKEPLCFTVGVTGAASFYFLLPISNICEF